jgi:8-amino-7-oxononanoate synthase
LVCSLAKAFGAPLAALSGTRHLVRCFEARSFTRVHSSPPSAAATRSAARALDINESAGKLLRGRLAARIDQFRSGLRRAGLHPRGGHFPVQVLAPPEVADPPAAHARLRQAGVVAVLTGGPEGRSSELTFLLTARHTWQDIDTAVAAAVWAIGTPRRRAVA